MVLRRKRKFSNFFILELTERREIAIILKLYDSLAQLAEHLTFNQGVRSSNLRWVTNKNTAAIFASIGHGEVSEWFKELVLKTSDSERGRGFESHPLRHNK